ncbi:MAG: hypothetical protein CYPHOPRED_005658 [Cyphobasidiales sp. Tagirdzhanova-0007]|nr:MAG: hypothetical protein CYPHOPRED_005658 [Cyphobasidiales sp. Tagirdzhanova-0007]
MIAETTRAKVEFHEKYWKKITDEAKVEIDFITSLIQANPDMRSTAEVALKHPWLTQGESLPDHDISFGLRENWDARRRWKKAISGVQAAVRLRRISAAASADSRPRTSGEYNTATEDEGGFTDDETMAGSTVQSSLRATKTEEIVTREQSRDIHRELDFGMASITRRAQEMSNRE